MGDTSTSHASRGQRRRASQAFPLCLLRTPDFLPSDGLRQAALFWNFLFLSERTLIKIRRSTLLLLNRMNEQIQYTCLHNNHSHVLKNSHSGCRRQQFPMFTALRRNPIIPRISTRLCFLFNRNLKSRGLVLPACGAPPWTETPAPGVCCARAHRDTAGWCRSANPETFFSPNDAGD